MRTNSSVDRDQSSQVQFSSDYSNYIKTLHIDSDHLYRYLTEVNGRDTRRGYIKVMLEFQEQVLMYYFVLLDATVYWWTESRVATSLLA